MKINVELSAPLFPVLCLGRREVRDITRRILENLDCRESSLNLVITDDSRMQHLNSAFLFCPGPTNVLAFEEESKHESGFLGEVFISAQAVKRESTLYGQPVFEHFVRLLAHGIEHLAGFEHGPEMEDRTLHLQRTIKAEEYGL
ncbi:rRNA maturation RNase YbeY [Desulfonatronospira sp. MSAO_Bac3]|uniref:rRNA maturation RNase YbeY n=1 Tax=Desulfonatronospira sp. MSAO_Bac3 TaxID=2293857 RepID=UPI00257DB63C|nr:rRNA maturation RNase YbeY [Desulfonatronospira sp. MSAO_Bac3]